MILFAPVAQCATQESPAKQSVGDFRVKIGQNLNIYEKGRRRRRRVTSIERVLFFVDIKCECCFALCERFVFRVFLAGRFLRVGPPRARLIAACVENQK